MRVLTGAKLIDGTGAGPVGATIVIEGQRIAAVETRSRGDGRPTPRSSTCPA